MASNVSLQMALLAGRIARENGVTTADVLAKFKQGVRKSALSYNDFFWGKSDISLTQKKVFRAGRADELAATCGLTQGGGR